MPRPTNLPQPSDSFTSLDQATKSYTHTPTDAELQQITTTVGNPDLTDFFYPHVRMSRWGGEAWVELQLQFNAGAFEEQVEDFGDGRLVFTHADAQMRFYPLGEDDLPGENDALGHGGYEIDAVLASKPAQNSIAFNVVTNNCELWYQPDGPTQDAANGDPAGTNLVPENAVGSYAVYATGGRSNNRYRTGKVCHLYRPKVIDNNGDWIYGDYNDDAAVTGVLTVTVNRQWLRDAAYPVVIDPTAGYSSAGSSTRNVGNYEHNLGNASGNNDDSTGSLSGDATIDANGVHAYVNRFTSSTVYFYLTCYEDTGTLANDNKLAFSSGILTSTTFSQEQIDGSISGTMSSGTAYRCGVYGDAGTASNQRIYQDFLASSANVDYDSSTSSTPGTTLTGYITTNNRCSIWFDYTLSASSTARVTAVDVDITYDLKASRIAAVDADITYDQKTGRITAVDADITYTYPANSRITAADADITYNEKTSRVTAVDADVTYDAKWARITAADADITYTRPDTARITAVDADITYDRTITFSQVFGRADVGFRIVPDPGTGGGGGATKGGYIPDQG